MARRLISRFGTCGSRTWRASTTFSNAFSRGSRRCSWKMKATSRRSLPRPRRHQRCSPRPPTQSSPAFGRSCPCTRRRSVVLPEPLGPVTSKSSPWATVTLTPFRTALRPKDFVTSTSLIAGCAAGSPLVPGRCLIAPFVCACALVGFLDARARPVVAGRLPTLRFRLAHAGFHVIRTNVPSCDHPWRSPGHCPGACVDAGGRSLGKSVVPSGRADLRHSARLRAYERDDRSVRR